MAPASLPFSSRKVPQISFFLLSILILFHSPLAAEDATELRNSLQLLPLQADASPFGFGSEGLPPPALAVAQKGEFARWKTYDDKDITFSYPEDPLISLEVIDKSSPKPIRIQGGPVTTAENSFFRAYVLKIANQSYAVLLLDESDHFDDGICLCGAIAYEKYKVLNGALGRFSFLESGQIKKMQLRKGNRRLVFFEWTHLPIHQKVYLAIAQSVRLKTAGDGQSLELETRKKYGPYGFLEKGLSRPQIIDLLGTPSHQDRGNLVYTEQRENKSGYGRQYYTITRRLALSHDLFNGFSSDWLEYKKLAPKKGSPEWILQKADYEDQKQGNEDYDVGSLKKTEVPYLFDQVVTQLPQADPLSWSVLAQALMALEKTGHRDPRVVQEIKKRYLDPTLPSHHASWFLHEYEPQESRDYFVKRIQLVYQRTPAAKRQYDNDDEASNVGNLLRFLGKNHPEIQSLVEKGAQHINQQIRWEAYMNIDYLPPIVARSYCRKGLTDSYSYVRGTSAQELGKTYGEVSDLPSLKKALESERDRSAQTDLREAIDQLQKRLGLELKNSKKQT
jgi:hypothetical protein